MTTPSLDDLFNLLDKWRHLPSYRLEPRADPFFALFLPDVLESHYRIGIDRRLVPEFPLKKPDNNQSTKVDYMALSKNREYYFLIELKTDLNSLNCGQAEYLKCATGKTMTEILCELKEICATKRPSDHRKKYFHLLRQLACLGVIRVDPALEEKVYGSPQGVTDLLKKGVTVTTIDDGKRPRVIYVLPNAEEGKSKLQHCQQLQPFDFDCIGFDEFADCVKQQGEIGERFAKRIRGWTTPPGDNTLSYCATR